MKRLNLNVLTNLYSWVRLSVSKIKNPVLLEPLGHYFRLISSTLRKYTDERGNLGVRQMLFSRSISKRWIKLKEAFFQRKSTWSTGEKGMADTLVDPQTVFGFVRVRFPHLFSPLAFSFFFISPHQTTFERAT